MFPAATNEVIVVEGTIKGTFVDRAMVGRIVDGSENSDSVVSGAGK